ncbi:redoxin domain-containing protein [Gluconobacter japonicus]|uniref:redoxin domain-containing protein n=1 Tax=Gluconobacter japonicus TaxID=376620 RepID=UPI0039EA187C
MMRLDEYCPAFSLRTTEGEHVFEPIQQTFKLIVFLPSPFSVSDTQDIMNIDENSDFFSKNNINILLISRSSVYANLGWIEAIQKVYGREITTMIGEDPTAEVFKAYGVTNAKAAVIVDKQARCRWHFSLDRRLTFNIEEIKRAILALIQVSGSSSKTPEGWGPGDKTIKDIPLNRKSVLRNQKWFYDLSSENK